MTTALTRPLTKQDLDAAYEPMAREACRIINEDQDEALPQVAFFQVDDNRRGLIHNFYMIDPRFVAYLYDTDGGQGALRTAIAASLGDEKASPFPLRESLESAGVRADIAVQVSEGWTADAPQEAGLPSEQPDRGEALVVLVHVRGHTYGQLMEISTIDGRRHVEYAPLNSPGGRLLGTLEEHTTWRTQ